MKVRRHLGIVGANFVNITVNIIAEIAEIANVASNHFRQRVAKIFSVILDISLLSIKSNL